MVQLPEPIDTADPPRRVLAELFKSVHGELPIGGGWGYTREDAVVIDAQDPVVPKGVAFDGVGLEYVFVEERIHAEMILLRPPGQRFAEINWQLLQQALMCFGDRHYDRLMFEITALAEADWQRLKADLEGPTGHGRPGFDLEAHTRDREHATVRFAREFWFDITSFYGRPQAVACAVRGVQS